MRHVLDCWHKQFALALPLQLVVWPAPARREIPRVGLANCPPNIASIQRRHGMLRWRGVWDTGLASRWAFPMGVRIPSAHGLRSERGNPLPWHTDWNGCARAGTLQMHGVRSHQTSIVFKTECNFALHPELRCAVGRQSRSAVPWAHSPVGI
jgi:hypothetical protein